MPSGNRRRPYRTGFTMIELLTVIGIIVILISILLPVISTIRRKAAETDTRAVIGKLSTACNAYYQDFTAYPGPISENSVDGAPSPIAINISAKTGASLTAVTSSENLVLGLVGALYWAPTVKYDPGLIAAPKGPQSLNAANPQQYKTYIDVGSNDLAQDSQGALASLAIQPSPPAIKYIVPEFVDHFSVAKPIIYLRARSGSRNMVYDPLTGSPNSDSQYVAKEIGMYWIGKNNVDPFPSVNDPANNGLPDYPTAAAFFMNQTLNDGFTPRNKDSFILISAGSDGIYGTKDDITNSN